MRDSRIDFLRFVGLSLIMLAHVDPPFFIFQIRNFDVPLMVIVSGMSLSISKNKIVFFDYVLKRFKRLIIPTWIFLCVFFVIFYCVKHKLDAQKVIDSFLLDGGIGYVWIIKVFFIIALFVPVVRKIDNIIVNDRSFICVFFLFCVFFELLRVVVPVTGFLSPIYSCLITYLPWVNLFLLGARIIKFDNKSTLILITISFLIFTLLGVAYTAKNGFSFVSTQDYKYPPGLYYISFGVFLSSLLWRTINERITKLPFVISFVSNNSIWIYLWHILFIFIISKYNGAGWGGKYFLVYVSAVVVVYIQVMLIALICSMNISPRTKRNISHIFTG